MGNIPEEGHDRVAWQMQARCSPEPYWTMNLTCNRKREGCASMGRLRAGVSESVRRKKRAFIAQGESLKVDVGVGVAIPTPGQTIRPWES